MKRLILSIGLLLLIFPVCDISAQKTVHNGSAIERALEEMAPVLDDFDKNLRGQMGIDSAIHVLLNDPRLPELNEYNQFVLGNLFFGMHYRKAFEYHEIAYLKRPDEQQFILEYAIDLHRMQEFGKAIPLYERYLHRNTDDYRVYVWLADCFVNTGNTKRALQCWNKAKHHKNHTGIDQAIFIIYGSDPIIIRDKYLTDLKTGNSNALLQLMALDANWNSNWWNMNTRADLMNGDLAYAVIKFGNTNETVKLAMVYKSIKQTDKPETIAAILKENNLITEGGHIPRNGDIASDLVRICLNHKLFLARDFYVQRGAEVLSLAKELKDKQMLNLYAYLKLETEGTIDEQLAAMGWNEFHDERFAYDFFIHKRDSIICNKPELDKALSEFPNSSRLYEIRFLCAAKKHNKALLTEMIRREFKSLQTDPGRYTYALNLYFSLLKKAR